MRLNYFELLSPDPVYIRDTGSIISPTLREISRIGYDTYRYYLTVFAADPKMFFAMTGKHDMYELLSDEERPHIKIYDLLTANRQSAVLLAEALNFFIREQVSYSRHDNSFIIGDNGAQTGIISKETYPLICDLILQRNCIRSKQGEDLSKVKSKKAAEILKKLQKGKAEKAKTSVSDNNMELANIISAVANRSRSLNMLNIWDLTVFQLWDCFSRLSANNIYDIQSMSVAAWGNKGNHFDAAMWFKKMEPDN